MSEIYISMDEAAELENLSYKGLSSRILRNPEKYNILTEPNPNGGKELVKIALSSLSAQAQRAYTAQQAAKKIVEDDSLWYLYADFNWYKEKYTGHYNKAVEMAGYIRQFVSRELKMKPGEFQSFLAKKYNTSKKTIQRAVEQYRIASLAAIQREAETGENYDYFKILSLARKPREDYQFPSLTEEMKASIENIYYDEIFAANMSPITNLCEDLRVIAEEKDWPEVPSDATIRRYVNYINDKDGAGARDLAAKGLRHWKNKYMMKRSRDTGSLKVFEVLQGDCHTFDCWVSVTRANGKRQAIRPTLVSWIDTKSRVIAGWVICENPDAQIIKQSILNVIYPKKNPELPYGVPKYLLIDNGKEFTAKTLTGVDRNVRFTFDDDIEGFFKSVGINDNMRSLPYQPWGKAQEERWHNTINLKFTKRMKSYTGTLTGKYTEAKIKKDIEKMLENGELMTIEDFSDKFEHWVANNYHKREHQGLIDQGEEFMTPIEVYKNAERYYQAPPPIDYAISLLMKGDTRVVTKMGIQRTVEGKKIFYTSSVLMSYQGKRVTFKYNPEDVTKLIVYAEDGKRICEAVSYELLHIAPKLSEAALVEHIKDQKRQLRNDRDTVKKRRMPYEERQTIDFEAAGKKVVGPELSEDTNKVVSTVKSKRYKEDKKADRLTHSEIMEESKYIENSYLKKKAEEVYALMAL